MTCALVLRNGQRTRALNISLIRRITRRILESEFHLSEYELGLHLVEAPEMAEINQRFLQHAGSTDVITFDHNHGNSPARLHGEIYISVSDAVEQAGEFGTTWQSEVVRYIIHGLLHLRGYDDLATARRREMKREENRLLRIIESKFVIHELARTRKS
jgi:probable rRNA maturation factor